MNTTTRSDTVWFTTKGQVVIPLRLRKLYHIEDGTRAIVTATHEGILLKPVTAALAKKHKAQLVTDNPEFKAVEKEVRIVWLRPK